MGILGRAALHQEARPPRVDLHKGQPDVNKRAAQVKQQRYLEVALDLV